jgi:class 3 adenylate cyclase/tetratricopeptide (TPR) repeat protein
MESLGGWLRSLGLGKYEASFRENEIDETVLPNLTEEHLKQLGVTALGHRMKLLDAIADLRTRASVRAPSDDQAAPGVSPSPQDHAERRQLTVMFTDLVDSTALSTRLDPEDLRAVMASYHRCVAETVGRFNGFVAKYMGDGVLTYFGYPRAAEHDAEQAVRAGLALVEAVPKLETNAGTRLQVRVGIGTGLVVVGDLLGEGAAKEQAVVGETPNLAARLQAAAAPGTVVIGPATRRLLGSLFDYNDLGAIEVKGFDKSVNAYQVVRQSTTDSRFEALRASTTPLVGRDEEIELLLRRWAQAKGGDGQVVLICGEPGIGKSRITQTLVERVAGEPHTRLRYFCSPHHQDSALYPSITQLERAASFRREDTDAERLEKLEAVLAQGTNDLSEAVPLLADLLSIPIGDRYPPLNLTPQKRKERTLQVQLAQIEGLAARQPVVVAFEDVHWSDATTRESLDLIIDRMPALRVLMIITFRPEFNPPWVGRPHVTMLTVSRLPPRRRAEMIAHVTGGRALPKEIADQIINRTDGVPLFIEELTKTVVESGIVAEEGDRYALKGPVAPLAIPTTLHGSLLARLDRLAPTRELAQIGAALGRQFSHELISAVAEMPPQQLDDAMSQLLRAELVFRRGTPPDAEYTFKHALVQDAAYSTLLRSRRQQLHARIATTLEQKFPEIVAAQPALLAHHCAEAGLAEKAVGYWLKAGQQAIARSAMTEGEAQLGRGLELLSSLPENDWRWQQELDLLTALGSAQIATKGYGAPDVGKTCTRASALAKQLDRADYLIGTLYGLWGYHLCRCEHKQSMAFAEELEQIGDARPDPVAALLGHVTHGLSCMTIGEPATACALFEQCLGATPEQRAASVALSAADQYPFMLAYFAAALTYLGYIDQGRARRLEAESVARQTGHAYTMACTLSWAAIGDCVAGLPGEAKRHSEEAVALSIEHGFPTWEGVGKIFIGWALTELTTAKEGLGVSTEGLSIFRGCGTGASNNPYYSSLFFRLHAEIHARLGSPVEALRCLDEAQRFAEATNERREDAELCRLRGDLLVSTGDPGAAEQYYHKALAIARQQSTKLFELRAATSLARLWRDQRKRTEGHDLLAPIYGWFTEGFDTPVLQDAKSVLNILV